jgi:hypothetical protein
MNCRRAIYALLAVAAAGFAGAVGLYSGSEPARLNDAVAREVEIAG